MPFVNHRVVRDALDDLDMSAAQLAKQVGRPVRTVRNVIGGHQVASTRTILRIARAVNVPIEHVITDKHRAQQDEEPFAA